MDHLGSEEEEYEEEEYDEAEDSEQEDEGVEEDDDFADEDDMRWSSETADAHLRRSRWSQSKSTSTTLSAVAAQLRRPL